MVVSVCLSMCPVAIAGVDEGKTCKSFIDICAVLAILVIEEDDSWLCLSVSVCLSCGYW